jgi:hypothetical protein
MKISEALRVCQEACNNVTIITIQQLMRTDGTCDELQFTLWGGERNIYGKSLEEAVEKFLAYYKATNHPATKDIETKDL